MSDSDAELKPVWVSRPVTVRALADALVTVKAYEVIRELMELRVFAKVDTVLEDDLAVRVARIFHRKLEILEYGGRR